MIKFVLNDDRCLRESSANGRAVNGGTAPSGKSIDNP